MSKKIIPVVLVISGIIFVVAAIFFFVKSPEEKELLSPGGENLSNTKKAAEKEKSAIYTDEAGFSFTYPQSLLVKEKENQDSKTYSSLELTQSSRPGETLTVKVEDTNFTTIEEWLTRNKSLDWQINETVLSGMNGKFIVGSGQIITVAISQGIIFLIESPADTDNYWLGVQKIINDGFTVKWPTPKEVSFSTEDNGIEEIIE